jgi:hypothetical protein
MTQNNSGNREWVIRKATGLANVGQDLAAYGLVLITQCHNSECWEKMDELQVSF